MVKEKHDDSYSHVLKYTGIFGGVQGLNILISLVRNKIVAKLLGPSGMGLVSLFNSSVNFISTTTTFGVPFSAVRHVSELFEKGNEEEIARFIKVVRAWSLLSALLGMLVCVLLGPVLSNYTFSWGDHTLHFVLLAPAVGMLAITGGETAILKGARQLKSLALIQLVNIFLSLIISVPIYYFFGQKGIVPIIVFMAFSTMILTIRHSYRLYPLQLKGKMGILGEGMEMVRLGMAFMIAAIFASGAEMVVRSYLNVIGELDVVGLYNAGFMLTMTYGSMVFSAMETDFFPRLSAVNSDRFLSNQTVNRQIEVSLLIISPMLLALIFGAPILIPLLFTNEFLPVVSMIRFTAIALYLRAIKLPICYLTLAKGEARSFLFLEASYYIVMVVAIIFGYQWGGLEGTGAALLVAGLFELVTAMLLTYFRYGYTISGNVFKYAVPQIALGVLGFIIAIRTEGIIYWLLAVILTAVSLFFSLFILHSKTSLWNKLVNRLKS